MADVSSVFDEILGAGTSDRLTAPVPQASNAKGYRDAAANHVGNAGTGLELEDILNPDGGDPDALAQEVGGYGQYVEDSTASRPTNWQATGDSIIDVVNGAVQGGLGIGALGAGIVDADAGAAVSQFANDANSYFQSKQSRALAGRREAHAARNEVTAERNQQKYDQEIAEGSSEFMASLRQVGRDVVDGVTNVDGVGFVSGTSQGIGSLLIGGVIGKGLKAAGGAAAARMAVGKAGPSAAAFQINRLSQAGAMPIAIGALEGGGAYTQTVNEVMALEHEQLLKTSPDYRDLIAQGWDPVDARAEVANHAGLTAAAIQAPIGVATGALVSKFEGNPLAASSIASRVGNVFKETLEEGIQSGSGQLATNVAIQQNADETKSLTDNVGQAIGEGALYGAGTAGALQAPGAPIDAAKIALAPVAAAGRAVGNAFEQRRLAQEAKLAAEAPNSLVNTQAPAEAAAAVINQPGVLDALKARVAENAESDEKSLAAVEKIDRLVKTISFDPTAEAAKESNDFVKSVIGSSTDTFDLLKRMSAAVTDPKVDPVDRIFAGVYLRKLTQEGMADSAGRLVDALEGVDQEDPAFASLKELEGIVDNFASSPEIATALEQSDEYLKLLTADRIKTGRGARMAEVAAKAAVQSPDKVAPDVVDEILAQESKGDLPLDPAEKAALQAIQARNQVQKTDRENSKKLGLKDSKEVSYDILDGEDDSDYESLATHQKLISLAVHAGNNRVAKERLEGLMTFAQHLNNKVAAINTNLIEGDGNEENATTFRARRRETGKLDTVGKAYVNPEAPKTVKFAQRVAEDARAVVTLANQLAAIYGDLGVSPIELVELDSSLQESADKVRTNYRIKTGKFVPGGKKAEAEPAQEQSTPLAQERSEPKVEPTPDSVAPIEAAEVEAKPVEVEATRSGDAPGSKIRRQPKPYDRADYIKQVTVYLKSAARGMFLSKLAYPADQARAGEQGLYRFAYRSEAGQLIQGKYTIEGDFLADFEFGDTNNPVDLGPGEVREMFNQLFRDHPDVKLVQAFRMTGARAKSGKGPQELWMQRDKDGSFTLLKSNPREAGADAEVASEASNDTAEKAPAEAVEKTNEPDQPSVEEKSEVVETATEKSGDESAETVDKVEDNSTQPAVNDRPATVAEAYPNLIGGEANRFLRSFKIPSQPISRLLGLGGQLVNTIYLAFKDMDAIRAFAGKDNRFFSKPVGDQVRKDYQAYLKLAPQIVERINAQAAAFLSKGDARALKSMLESETDEDPTGWVNGRAAALIELNEQGVPGYNQELLQGAVLATLQWLLVANTGTRTQDKEDIAQSYNMDINFISGDVVDYLNAGLTTDMAKQQLSQTILRFWGLSRDQDAPIGDSMGVVEALAAELISAVTFYQGQKEGASQGLGLLIAEPPIKFGPAGAEVIQRRFMPRPAEGKNSNATSELMAKLRSTKADLIEKLVVVEPEQSTFIGSPPTGRVQFQMGSPFAEVTKQQQQAIDFYRQVPFKPNMRMVALYESMTEEEFVTYFGGPVPVENVTNVNHKKSLDGKRTTARSSYQSFRELMGQIRLAAEEQGIEPGEVEVFYDFGVSSVGRLHMLGRNNPQASKLMREIMLPSRGTVDLILNEEHRQMFFAAVMQHWDIKDGNGRKVHQMPLGELQTVVEEAAKTKFPKSIELMRRNKTGALTADELQILREEFGDKLTPGAIHALQEYARFTKATASELDAFETALYLEADGVTDGPINAMILLGMDEKTGEFTEQWLRTVAKGGLSIGNFGPAGRNLAQHYAEDSKDVYTQVKEVLERRLAEMSRRLNKQVDGTNDKRIISSYGALLRVMAKTIDGMSFENGKIIIDRGVAKNPVTVTIYGSGSESIARKIVSEVVDAIYEDLSSPEGLAKFVDLKNDLDWLINNEVKTWTEKDGTVKIYVKKAEQPVPANHAHPSTYTLTAKHKDNMTTAVHKLFVGPLIEAMEATIGETRRSTTAMNKAVQVQGAFLQHMFKGYLQDRLRSRDKSERRDLLTPREIQQGYDQFRPLWPLISTKTQNFFVAKFGKAHLADPDNPNGAPYPGGNDYAQRNRSAAKIKAPVNPGVKAKATLVIGPGDGQIMQNNAVDPNGKPGLPVFDGYNFALSNAAAGSQALNKAVFDAWQGNPVAAVAEAFSEFLNNADLDQLGLNDDLLFDVARVFMGEEAAKEATSSEVINELNRLKESLDEQALLLEARHNVLNRTTQSVDHMASAGQPYVHTGSIDISSRDPAEVVAILNEELAKEVARLRRVADLKVPPSTDIAKELRYFGEINEFGNQEATIRDVQKLVRRLNVPKDHKELLQLLLPHIPGGYQVVIGSLETINVQRRSQNLAPLVSDGKAMGYTLPGENRIYIINPSSETLVHELVHIATFKLVKAYYDNPGSLTEEQRNAIFRIEKMMENWLVIASTEGDQISADMLDAVRAVLGHQGKGNHAAALNEFMAWNLANPQLIEQGKTDRRFSVLETLAEIASKVRDSLKKLWGWAKAPHVADDLFTNLRFNTMVLLKQVPPITEHIDEVLEHSVSGNSERVRRIRDGFARKIQNLVESQKSDTDKLLKAEQIERTLLPKALDAVKIFQNNGWPMQGVERQAFRNIVLALMTEAQLNPNALARMNQHYAAVMKELTPDHFLPRGQRSTINERGLAIEKLNTLKGVNGYATDDFDIGRSTLMSAFLALSLTSDEFRSVLERLPVKGPEKSDAEGINKTLENGAIEIIEAATKRVAGERQQSASVQAAIDTLAEAMMAGNAEDVSIIEQASDRAGNAVDQINDLMVEGISKGANWTHDKLTELMRNPPNPAVGKLAKYLRTIVSVFDDKLAGAEAEGITSFLNQKGMPIALREFWTEISGRLDSNASIYDMIKVVRTFVQQTRQQFRDHRPKQIAKKFSRALEDHEWAAMTTGLAKTDFASLFSQYPMTRLLAMLSRPAAVQVEIRKLEEELNVINPAMFPKWEQKMRQLATYMNTGKPGHNLLRNAYAVANLRGELSRAQRRQLGVPSQATVDLIDRLVSLYALQSADPAVLETLKDLADNENDGMAYVVAMLVGQRKDEMAKVTSDMARNNHFKGYVPTENKSGHSLIVADDAEFTKLAKRGYTRVADYTGSPGERTRARRGYYFTTTSGRAAYMQGIMQNVRTTAYGIDPRTGYANGPATGGVINFPGRVNKALIGRNDAEPLMPIYDDNDQVVGYERSLDPAIAAKLEPEQAMHEVIGIWQGRQAEEKSAFDFNADLVRELGEMWRREPAVNKDEYVNLFDKRVTDADPVLADTVSLLTPEVRELIQLEFGKKAFWVKRSMINDALGYRSPSVTDLWTGISRWSPEVQKVAQDVVFTAFGKEGFKYLVKAEQGFQTFISDARVTIVVKSVVVPMANIMSNVYHLASRGVPLKNIVRGFRDKAIEVDTFVKNRLRRLELQGNLQAARSIGDRAAIHTIEAELKGILDANRRLSIWPLIAAGEFASISDAGISNEEIDLVEGRLSAYVEKLTDKLPDGMKTLAKYGIISRDTALFKGLQRAVEYGDFLAKAVLYEDLTKRQGKSHEYARGRITEEFVNYDRQPGRWRSGLENNGLLWFWNFKLRATKIALSTIRNNPLHMFLAHLVPAPDVFGLDVGTPFTDNFVSVVAQGDAGWSIGLDQGWRAYSMNPWVSMSGI